MQTPAPSPSQTKQPPFFGATNCDRPFLAGDVIQYTQSHFLVVENHGAWGRVVELNGDKGAPIQLMIWCALYSVFGLVPCAHARYKKNCPMPREIRIHSDRRFYPSQVIEEPGNYRCDSDPEKATEPLRSYRSFLVCPSNIRQTPFALRLFRFRVQARGWYYRKLRAARRWLARHRLGVA